MYANIFKHLQSYGLQVFTIGKHSGLCKEPYVVIKENGQQPFLTSHVVKYIDFIVFYPITGYTEMQDYILTVQSALADLRELKDTYVVTPAVIDESVKAYTVSLRYRLIQKRRSEYE